MVTKKKSTNEAPEEAGADGVTVELLLESSTTVTTYPDGGTCTINHSTPEAAQEYAASVVG